MQIKNIRKFICAALCFCATTAFAQPSVCTPGGYVVGFFNGVFNTRLEADNGKSAIAAIDVGGSTHGEPVKYELFYNETGKDRVGVTRFEDVVEVFRQRAAEQDAVLGNRWELFWETLDSDTTDGSIGATIATATPALGSLLSALGNDVLAQIVAGLTSSESHPPTIRDYSAQKTLLDAHITQKEKIILIAHSQGNLFMNVAYNYGVAKTTQNQYSVTAQ